MSNALNQLRQSVAALQKGNLAEAIRLAQAILWAEPKNFDAHHIVALASYHGRDIATAQRHIERALAIRSDMPDAFNTHGLILRTQGLVADAATQFQRAVKLNPRSREAHYNLANCCQDLGRLPAAVEHYDAALRIEPGMVMAWNNRGLALRRMGRPQDALSSFDEAIRRAPDFAPAHYNRADGLAALQRRDEAIAGYDRAIALNPNFAEAHCNRANLLMELGRTAEALAGYDRAIALQPRFHQAQLSRGIALVAAGRAAEAEEDFRQAIALRPDYADAHYNLGKLLKEAGRAQEALACYDEALRLRPDHAESHSNRGNALNEMKRFDAALASYDRAIQIKPDYADAHLNRGNTLKELKRFDAALASYDRAIRLRPDWADAHTSRGNALAALERYEEAVASHREAIRLNPGKAELHNNLGNALAGLNSAEDALAAYDTAIALKPDYAMAFNNRGNALRDLNRPVEALASFDAALALKPGDPGIRYSKSSLALQQQDFIEGFELKRSRWDYDDFEDEPPDTTVPAWDGAPIDGEVLLWGEQGLGDEVFYASMLSLLDSTHQKLALSCDRRLFPIYARSFPAIRLLDRETTTKSIVGNFAAQAAIGDIGNLLRVDAARIAERRYPYLVSNAQRKHQFKTSSAFAGGGLVCGISWRSGNKKAGASRSLRLVDMAPILKVPGITFVNLQYGDVSSDIREAREQLGVEVQVIETLDTFGDIDGVISAIDACDTILTIDNVTAHFAGAIGKGGTVLVPVGRGRYWYWSGHERSLWYPSLRLVYQEKVGDWAGAISAAADLLERSRSSYVGSN